MSSSSNPERVVVSREPKGEREPREPKFRLDLEPLVLPAIIAGGLVFVAVYKDQIASLINKIVETIPHAKDILGSIDVPIYPLPPIKIPKPQPQPGPVGSVSQFGNGEVSVHGLASGGSAWRKQWEIHKRYLNMEFRGYFFIPRGNDNIAVKLRGGPHTGSGDNATTRQGCCYIFSLPFNGSNRDNFQKECPHPEYSKNTVGTKFSPGSIIGKWVGIKCRLINQGNGVRCQMWLDTSGKAGANQWRLWYDILDTGQYGDSSATRPPFTKSPVFGNNPQVIVRIDAGSKSDAQGYQMSYASVGEVGSANLAFVSDLGRVTIS